MTARSRLGLFLLLEAGNSLGLDWPTAFAWFKATMRFMHLSSSCDFTTANGFRYSAPARGCPSDPPDLAGMTFPPLVV
jgi:hypothetical protein